jgi:spermidine synthase
LKKKNERAVIRVVIATGISSVVTQLLMIREFLVQFQSNEFVIALILFNWLILGGTGTLLARWIVRRSGPATVGRLGWLSLMLAGLPAMELLAIRKLRDIFFIHGASTGFYPTLAYSFFSIAPYGLLIGFVLPYSLFVIQTERPAFPGAYIYITDNLGDVCGGALFSFALIYLVTPLQAIFVANLPLLAAAYFLFPPTARYRLRVTGAAGLTFGILLAAAFLETASLTPTEGKLVDYRESRYGRIEVHQDQGQFTLFIGGVPLSSSQNLVTAEETVHYPLAQLPRVNQVLMISAQGGMLAELRKYRPAAVDYVELDPEVAAVQFQYGLIRAIPGLNVIYQDGRTYLAHSKKIYDAIIVNLSEPETFQVNRFFTDRFFQLAKQHLVRHGVLSFSMQGFDNYLSEAQRQKISSLYNTAADDFKHVVMLPGQNIVFVCSDSPVHTDIPARLKQKGIHTAYISGYYYGNLTAQRIAHLNQLVDPGTPKNHDDFPQLMRLMFRQWFAKFNTSPAGFIGVLAAVTLIYLLGITREEYVLFSTGCMVMGSEVLVVFAFQIIFGYIYSQIGLIITVFLAGLLPGAWFGEKLHQQGKQVLVFTDAALMFLTGLLILGLKYGAEQLPAAFFLVFGFTVSLACGFQFPAALYLRGGDAPAVTRTFSADLIGAAFGTLITNVVLIPYCGILWAAGGLIGLKLSSFLIMVKPCKK